MTQNLAGMHDIESVAIAPPGTWVLDTIALSDNPVAPAYDSRFNWIARMNWGYGSTGTLPASDRYGDYLGPLSSYVRNSHNCHRWIIANEPNLSREWPDDQPIYPHHYAKCYGAARSYIHAIPGHKEDQVLIAAPGPWNNELKYSGNPNGDWIKYFEDVIAIVGSGCEGFALHAYTHGYNRELVTSTVRMNAPFENRYYEFRTYVDYCNAIPDHLRHLPCYITEANGNGPWQAVGLMPEMLAEIDSWNDTYEPKIQCVIFYRYPHYDDFYIEGRNDVIAEYKAAVGKGYTSPMMGATTMPETTFIPAVSTGTQSPALPPRAFDPRTVARGVTVETPNVAPGQSYWFAKRIQWLDEGQSQGRHHIYGDVYKDGAKVAGAPLIVTWPSGSARILTEDKSEDPPPFDYWYNYPMSPSLTEYIIHVDDGAPSEVVKGIGMGADGNSHVHTSTVVEWELATMPQTEQPAPTGPTATPITPAGANVRSGPNLSYPKLGSVAKGQPMAVTGINTNGGATWYRVEHPLVGTGWVSSTVVSVDNISGVPEVAAPTPEPTEPVTGDDWQRAIDWVLEQEGGFQNNPADKGNYYRGELIGTKFGISAASWGGQYDIPNLTVEQAKSIYFENYWRKSGADHLEWPLCLLALDTSILHGTGTAEAWLKEVGPNPYAFASKRLHVYTNSELWDDFGRGWVSRVSDLLEEVGKA